MSDGRDREEWLERITEPGPRFEPDYEALKGDPDFEVSEVDVSPRVDPKETQHVVDQIIEKLGGKSRLEIESTPRVQASGVGTSTCCGSRLVWVHSHYQCAACGRVEHGCCDGAPTDGG